MDNRGFMAVAVFFFIIGISVAFPLLSNLNKESKTGSVLLLQESGEGTVTHHSHPTKMSLQGKVTDINNAVIDDGNLTVKVSDQNSCTGGVFFTQDFNNEIQDGLFNILLGSQQDLNLNFNQDYYMCLYVNSELLGSPQQFRGGQGQIGSEDLNSQLHIDTLFVDKNAFGHDFNTENVVPNDTNSYDIGKKDVTTTAGGGGGSWWNQNFAKKRAVKISTGSQGIDVNGLIFVTKLNTSSWNIQADCDDVVVADEDTNLLIPSLVAYCDTNHTEILFALPAAISANTDVNSRYYIYYENAGATSRTNIDYVMAWYPMEEGSGTTIEDFAGSYDLTATNSNVWSTSSGDGYYSFYPNAIYWATNGTLLDTVPKNGTVEMYFAHDTTYDSSRGDRLTLMYKYNTADYVLYMDFIGGQGKMVANHTGSLVDVGLWTTTVSWTGNTWYRIAHTWGDSGLKLYANGVLEAQNADTDHFDNGTYKDFWLGARSTDSGVIFDGKIDEVIVSAVQRADFNTVSNVVVGDESSGGGATTTVSYMKYRNGYFGGDVYAANFYYTGGSLPDYKDDLKEISHILPENYNGRERSLNEDVALTIGSVKQLLSYVKELEAKVQTYETKISEMDSKMAELNSKIDSLNAAAGYKDQNVLAEKT